MTTDDESTIVPVVVSPTTTTTSTKTVAKAKSNESNAASTALPAPSPGHERLHKKLANLESTISELLSLKKATPVLKEKLSTIDDLILDIPDEDAQLASDWRRKVAIWWKKYAAADSKDDSGHGRGHRGPIIASERRADHRANGGDGGGRSFAPRRSPGSGSGSNSKQQDGSGQPQHQFPSKEEYHAEREKVRAELVADFNSLRALEAGSSDIEALKRLNGVVRKARTKTHPFDASLKEEIFCCAYRKLSPEKRSKFIELYGSMRMLVNLANFLRTTVDSYFQDLNIVQSGECSAGNGATNFQGGSFNRLEPNPHTLRHVTGIAYSLGNGQPGLGNLELSYMPNFDGRHQGYQGHPNRELRPEVGPNQCRYCREEGHRIHECEERNAKRCYNCNQPGHTSKYCKFDKVVAMMDNASISN